MRSNKPLLMTFAVALVASVGLNGPAGAQDVEDASSDVSKVLVMVAGATGRTGQHVIKELLANGFRVRAFVRDVVAAQEKLGLNIEYVHGDVRDRQTIDGALDGVSAIICAIGSGRGDPSNGPEFVDYGGVRNLAEAAAAANLKQFALVSSGGVTHEDHVLNKMFNNVLIWKFKGEEAVRNSGVPYTIVRPGGLVDKPSQIANVILLQGDQAEGMISRTDVAKVLVESLRYPDALGKTFEIVSSKDTVSDDWQSRFDALAAD